MIIAIPFVEDKEFIDDAEIEFFQAVRIPAIQGGREPSFVNKITPSLEETVRYIERFGGRYKVLATSTEPDWNEDVDRLMDCMDKNAGVLVVTNLPFAERVRASYKNIKLHASSLAGLMHDFGTVMASPLFDMVGLPNLWHSSYEGIMDAVPEDQRGRVVVIVLKYCIWDERCKKHYSQISRWYKEGNVTSRYECHKSKTVVTKKPPVLINAGRLYQNGFRRFKLAARLALNLDYQRGIELLKERIKIIKEDIKKGGQ